MLAAPGQNRFQLPGFLPTRTSSTALERSGGVVPRHSPGWPLPGFVQPPRSKCAHRRRSACSATAVNALSNVNPLRSITAICRKPNSTSIDRAGNHRLGLSVASRLSSVCCGASSRMFSTSHPRVRTRLRPRRTTRHRRSPCCGLPPASRAVKAKLGILATLTVERTRNYHTVTAARTSRTVI